MLRSESNLLSRTHWWKVQSSMAIDCFPLLEDIHRSHTLNSRQTSSGTSVYWENTEKTQMLLQAPLQARLISGDLLV